MKYKNDPQNLKEGAVMNTGNANEFKNLVETEKEKLWARAIGLTRKSEDAEDLLQDTVMKAYKNWNRFEMGTNFRAWMNRIMLNTHINNVNRRRDKAACDFSTGECDNIAFHTTDAAGAPYSNSPEEVFFNHHIDEGLQESLYSLPDSYRIPFSLFHFEGYKYEDIAKMLDLPDGTVKSRIFRARRSLQDSYGKCFS